MSRFMWSPLTLHGGEGGPHDLLAGVKVPAPYQTFAHTSGDWGGATEILSYLVLQGWKIKFRFPTQPFLA